MRPDAEQVVMFNASLRPWRLADETVPADGWRLHPVLRDSSDPLVRTAVYVATTHTFEVPARTTAVFTRASPLALDAADG